MISITTNLYDKFDKNIPNILLIHPAFGDSIVYKNLSLKLADKFNCIGIDNYNIHNSCKINNLNELANIYLSEYLKKYSLTNPIYFLGWSLGGLLALEIAGILESRGVKYIKVILLDTIIPIENTSLIDLVDKEKNLSESLKSFFIKHDYDRVYIDKITSGCDADLKLSLNKPSSLLKHANVTLIKALEIDDRPGLAFEFNEKNLDLAARNIDKYAKNLNLVELSCHHSNILKYENEIVLAIKNC